MKLVAHTLERLPEDVEPRVRIFGDYDERSVAAAGLRRSILSGAHLFFFSLKGKRDKGRWGRFFSTARGCVRPRAESTDGAGVREGRIVRSWRAGGERPTSRATRSLYEARDWVDNLPLHHCGLTRL
jgi:hypothetical protein